MTARVLTLTMVGLVFLATACQAQIQAWMDPEFLYSYNGLKGDFYTTWGGRPNQPFGPWQGYANPGFPSGYYWADFYCIDLNIGMYGTGHVWDVYYTDAVPPAPPIRSQGVTDWGLGWAAHLYNSVAYGLYNVGTTQAMLQRAGLQIAIWEAIYDGAPGYAWDLTGGNFWLTDIYNLEYYGGYTAQQFLQTYVHPYLDNYQAQSIAGYWDNGQDLLGPIPEPTTLLLLGLGLSGSGLAVLRRKRR